MLDQRHRPGAEYGSFIAFDKAVTGMHCRGRGSADFAERLERAILRSGGARLIEHQPLAERQKED